MDSRAAVPLLVGALTVLVGFSLVASPVTMSDWGEQATVAVEPTEASQVDADTPVLQYANLSADAQRAVRRAIDDPDGRHTIYGRQHWPAEFTFSDYAAPGHGVYVVVYGGQYYRVQTLADGGFPFVYWILELPFIAYGFTLLWLAVAVAGERVPTGTTAIAVTVGASFHLLGPATGFPVIGPLAFVGLGIGATVTLVPWLVIQK